MNPEPAFLQALIARPDDLTCRLIYADWLEERGDIRAEYLRLDCQRRSLPETDEQRRSVEVRLKKLRFTLPQDWLVWVHWPGYGPYPPTLPALTHHLAPRNGAEMRMPRGGNVGGVQSRWAIYLHLRCGSLPLDLGRRHL